MHLRLPINPLSVPEFAREWVLEHLFQSAVRSILRIRHDKRDVSLRSTSSIPPRPIVLVLRHCRIRPNPWISRTPLNIATRYNRVIQISVCEYASVTCIPRSSQSTLANDIKRAVCSKNRRVVDVSTVMVYKSGVCAFPGCDAAAAVAEGKE